ncbi:ninjurin-1 [Nothobranchius furzeri]|nr:ninjurin-1-like [Nothobranchius furzeri]
MMNGNSSSRGSGAESHSSFEATHSDGWPVRPALLNKNHYTNKKSAAESMLDVALLMANASQLKAVLEQGPDPTVTLISLSLCLQVTVRVLLIFIAPPDSLDRSKW